MFIRPLFGIALGLAVVTTPRFAAAGSDHKVFRPAIDANGHSFYGVSVEDERCMLALKIYYFAPKALYDGRTVHRFRAKVEFARGGSVFTRTFTNRRTGNRSHYYTHRTRRRGCWARNKVRIKAIKVVSCSGRKCKLPKLR